MEPSIVFRNICGLESYSQYLNTKSVSNQHKPEDLTVLVDQTSQEWYYVAPYQVLVPITALNTEGKRQYTEACRRVEKESPRDIITDAILKPVSAGPWYPDKNSPHYNPEDNGLLNSLRDLVLEGRSSGGKIICTSKIKWKGVDKYGGNWVITHSGSLYYYLI